MELCDFGGTEANEKNDKTQEYKSWEIRFPTITTTGILPPTATDQPPPYAPHRTSEVSSFPMRLPVEIFERVVRLLYLGGTPATLNSVSLCSKPTNLIARKLQFQIVTISTYYDLRVWREIVSDAKHLAQWTTTLRVVRVVDQVRTRLDNRFTESCVWSSTSIKYTDLNHPCRYWSNPPTLY